MATINSPELVSLKVPAKYLEDVRTAVIAEIVSDTESLRLADNPDDRASSQDILHRSTRLLDPLLGATEEVELRAEHDHRSSPLVHLLEALVRLLCERLRAAAQYGPLPMGDVLDIAAELRWAADEASRIEPGMAVA